MPKQVDRESLLKRWSELAPKECQIRPDSAGRFRPDAYWVPVCGDWQRLDSGSLSRAVLLLALIDAIRTRGWHYRLESDVSYQSNLHVAHVSESKEIGAAEMEPCDSLLAAYVAALEATK